MVAERDEHGRFVKGHASNGGRPRGLAEQARAATQDGKALIEFYVKVFANDAEETKLRMQAAEWLADRGWGKAVQSADVHVSTGPTLQLDWGSDSE